MNNKIMILPIMIFFLIGLVSAVPSLTAPISNSLISGSSVTLTASSGGLIAMTSCIFYAKSPSTSTTTYTNIGTGTNTTASATSISTTFDSTTLQDSNDYSIYATCSNSSTQQNSATNTGITINNTIPTAPVLNVSTNTLLNNKVTNYNIKGTVNDAKTTGCTYSIYRNDNPSDGSSGSATYSGSSCSFTKSFTTSLDNGNWYFEITASDGSDTTSSAVNILQVQIPSNTGGLPIGYKVTNTDKSLSIVKSDSLKGNGNTILIIGLLLVLIGGFIAWRKRK